MRTIIPFCFLVLGLISPVSANKVDSLRQIIRTTQTDSIKGDVYLKLAARFLRQDPDLASRYVDSASMQPTYNSSARGQAEIAFYRGALAVNQGMVEEAIEHLELSRKSFQVLGDSSGVARIYYKLADLERNRNLDRAMDWSLKALDLYQQIGKDRDLANVYNLLGIIQKKIGRWDRAYEYYESALEIYQKLNHKNGSATVYLNLANVATRQKNYDLAEKDYNKALEIAKTMEQNRDLISYIYGNLGNFYSEQNQHEKSFEYNKLAFELRQDISMPEEKATALIGLGSSNRKLDRPDAAIRYFEEALAIAESHQLSQAMERTLKSLALTYGKKGNHQLAFEFYRKYDTLHDSMLHVGIANQVAELETKYQTAEKEMEIAKLNESNAEKNLALVQASRQRMLFLGGLLILALVAGLAYRQSRIRRRNEWVLAEKNRLISISLDEKETLLKEIHHRVKNNLQVISSLLSLQSRSMKDSAAIEAINEGKNRVKSMALIHQDLYQGETLMSVDAKNYVEKLTGSLLTSYNLRPDEIKLDIDIPSLKLDVDTIIPLGLILNELISNALKHAFTESASGTIKVRLEEKGTQLHLIVADNGKGISTGNDLFAGDSMGFKLIKAFSEKLKAEVEVAKGNGTRVILKIKNYKLAS